MIFMRRGVVLATLCILLFSVFTARAATPESKQYSHPPLTVQLPETVNDGTAFACVISGRGLRSATVSFLGKEITAGAEAVMNAPGSGIREVAVLLPVPLDHKKGAQQLTWTAALDNGSLMGGAAPVTVQNRQYPVQKLSVEPKYVTPDPALKERIARERKLMGDAAAVRSAKRGWPAPGDAPMLRPLPGKITSMFGLRRVLNGEPRGRHRGVDFRGAAGTPIKAVADGTVVLTGDFYYPGMFVIVDHGLGVITTSMHMSEIVAVQGQEVKAGDVLGLVGSTGRSTGPHLHLSMAVLGEGVDALPLLDMTSEDKALYAPPSSAKKAAAKTGGTKAAQKTGSGKAKAKPAQKTAKKPAQQSRPQTRPQSGKTTP